MRGAGQAGIVRTHGDFEVVQQRFGNFLAVEVLIGDGAYRFVHCLVITGGRDDQVGFGDQSFCVDLIMMEQRAARGFDYADSFQLTFPFLNH